jgi:hypothetical protein
MKDLRPKNNYSRASREAARPRETDSTATAKDKTRDKNVTRPLGPDVVDVKGQPQGLVAAAGSCRTATTTARRRPFHGHPGLPSPDLPCRSRSSRTTTWSKKTAPLTGELAIGRVRKVDDELVEVHWHALKDASVPTPMQTWWPTWVGADGTLRTNGLPMRGTNKTYEVNRSRVLYAFKVLDRDGRLPVEAPSWRGYNHTNHIVRHRLQSTLTRRPLSEH